MLIDTNTSYPIPDDPLLAAVAVAVRDSKDWAWIVDREWRIRYMSDEHRRSMAALAEMVAAPSGEHLFGPAMLEASDHWPNGVRGLAAWGSLFEALGGLVLADFGGDVDRLRAEVDPSLRATVDRLAPEDSPIVSGSFEFSFLGIELRVGMKALRIRDADGEVHGTLLLFQPDVGMGVAGPMAIVLDEGHLERTSSVARARRRPGAILFADLEGSSALSRSLSTASYFAVARRIVRATDRCVVDAGGLVGRHVGDGVVAFFPVEGFDSESDAVAACLTAARAVRRSMDDVADRSGLDRDDLVMRFGLHWGSTMHIGNISTAARYEVTGLGDDVNEAARIEACATGGRMLASKQLMERLEASAAEELDVDLDGLSYTRLSDLTTATEKARKDAPAIAVCAL